MKGSQVPLRVCHITCPICQHGKVYGPIERDGDEVRSAPERYTSTGRGVDDDVEVVGGEFARGSTTYSPVSLQTSWDPLAQS